MNRPPFDPVRAAFWLVAGVFIIDGVAVMMGFGICVWHSDEMIAGRFHCDSDNKLFDLLSAMLAAALGFAAGLMRGSGPPPSSKE